MSKTKDVVIDDLNEKKNPLLVCETETLEKLLDALHDATKQMQGERDFMEAIHEPVFEKMVILNSIVLKALAAKIRQTKTDKTEDDYDTTRVSESGRAV